MKISFLAAIFSKIYDFGSQNYVAMQTLPHKIMEQCRPCPETSQSLHSLPRKKWILRSLPSEIMEQWRLCSTKSSRHSFRGSYFRDLYNPLKHFFRKLYFLSQHLPSNRRTQHLKTYYRSILIIYNFSEEDILCG